MRRLYFLLPDLDVAHKVVDELLLARIEERHIHVIAKDPCPPGHRHDAPPSAMISRGSAMRPAMAEAATV